MEKYLKISAAVVFGLIAGAVACTRGNLDIAGLFCNQSPDVNKRFAKSQEYNETHPAVTYSSLSEDYRMFVCTDIHIDSVTTELDVFVNAVLADTDHCPAVLFLGDLQNAYGNLPLFIKHVQPLVDSPTDEPMMVVGNHDLYYGQWSEFTKYFGTASYYFYVTTPSGAKDIFICMDSASAVMGLAQRQWAEKILRNNADCRHKVICTHTHFFKRDGSQGHTSNYPLEETHVLCSMFANCGVDMVMTGHDHSVENTIYKGIYFRTFPALCHNDPESWYSIVHVGAEVGDYRVEDIKVR